MRLVLLSVFALAACGQPVEPPADPPPVQTSAVSDAPELEGPRFVGLWAASAEMCEDPAWRFEARQVTTQGHVHCDFSSVTEIPGGYAVNAACNAEGTESQHPNMEIKFAEADGAMLIESGPWTDPPGLVRCGPLPT